MTSQRRVPREKHKLFRGERQIAVTLRLPPDVACQQMAAGLVSRRHFRLKNIDGPRAHLAVGSPVAALLGDFAELAGYAQQKLRLPVGHLGVMWERVDVVAEPGVDPAHSIVWLRPGWLSDVGVSIVLSDDLERVVAGFAASGHLVSVGPWVAIDQQAVNLEERDAKRERKARRAGR